MAGPLYASPHQIVRPSLPSSTEIGGFEKKRPMCKAVMLAQVTVPFKNARCETASDRPLRLVYEKTTRFNLGR